MSWPLPTSWEMSAKNAILEHAAHREKEKKEKKQKAGSITPSRSKAPLYNFKQHVLRDKYYQIIGHHYVLDLCRIAFPTVGGQKVEDEKEVLANRLDRLIGALGINHTQRERWLAEKTFIEADNFFALSLLIMGRSIQSLPLCSNHDIVGRAVPSVWKVLASRYDRRMRERPDRATMLFVIGLMAQMVKEPTMTYNPHDTTRTKKNGGALRLLAESLVPEQGGNADLRENCILGNAEAIRDVLSNWGLAYSLFAMGRHKNWNEGGMS